MPTNKQVLDTIEEMLVDGGDPCYPVEMKHPLVSAVSQMLMEEQGSGPEFNVGMISDGYHTFRELYNFRRVYNALLFNTWWATGVYSVHKSKRHHTGEACFGGEYFIVMAQLPTGQISNHYKLKHWDDFQCEEREKADEWDGHTAKDALSRMEDLVIATRS